MSTSAKNKLHSAQSSDSPEQQDDHSMTKTLSDGIEIPAENSANIQDGGENLSAILLAWYDRERRILPWREDPTPYHVWLSEIMLQQTRVDTVIDYYNRFLAELPDVEALANAEEERILKLWQGLGYYSRIRNMHRAAKQVMEEFGGEIPGTPEELRKLSGIGEYVAAAISSIAFQYPAPSVDGNLLRVFARMTAYEESIRSTKAKRVAHRYYTEMLPQNRPGDMNQALMDLGATICLPNGMPLCGSCPWARFCESHQTGRELEIPMKEEPKTRKIEKKTMLRIVVDGRVLIRQRPPKGLLANLYELPNEPGWLTEEEAKEVCIRLGYRPTRIRKLAPNRRIFTHVEWHLQGYEMEAVPLMPNGWIASNDSRKEERGQTGSGVPFLATESELKERYSLPTAFKAYRPEN